MTIEKNDDESNELTFQEIVNVIREAGFRSPAIDRLLSAEIPTIPDRAPALSTWKKRLISELIGKHSPDSDELLNHFTDLHFVRTTRHGRFVGGIRWYWDVVRNHPGRLDAPWFVRIPMASVYPLSVVYYVIGTLYRTIKERLNRGDKDSLTN